MSSFRYPEDASDGISRPVVPRWLWVNLLSLDAPAVAVGWALLFARARGVLVSAATMGALASAVWLIYLGDRVLDGLRAGDSAMLRARHIFCVQHRGIALLMAAVAALAGTWLAREHLSAAEANAGLVMAACVGAYMLCVHAGGEMLERLLPKEVAVGLLFAAGTALPIWSSVGAVPRRALVSWLLFGLLCALNCVAIECWENRQELTSPVVIWADSRIGGLAAGIALAAGIVHYSIRTSGTVAATIACASLLILVLDCLRWKLPAPALRVLVDAALAIPAFLAVAVTARL